MSSGLGNSHGRSHRAWVELKAWSKANQAWVCWLCGEQIDRSLPVNHRMAWTLDHVLSKQDYPHLVHEQSNVRPAHRRCNSSKGRGEYKHKPEPKLRVSRRW